MAYSPNSFTGPAADPGGGYYQPGYDVYQTSGSADYSWLWYTDYERITDGTQVLDHHREDVNTEARARRGYTPKIRHTIAEADGREALARDLFFSLYQPEPKGHEVPLLPGYRMHGQVLSSLWSTNSFQELHDQSRGDDYLASLAAQGSWKTMLSNLDAETLAAMDRAAALEAALAEMKGQDEELEDAALLTRLTPAQRARLAALRAELAKRITELEADPQRQPDPLTQEQLDALAAAMASGIAKTADEVAEIDEALGLFGMGQNGAGRGKGLQWGRGATYEQKLELAKRMGQNETLRRIAELAGRMVAVALEVQRTRTQEVEEEIQDLVLGRDLDKLAPSDLALLGATNPLLKKLFYIRYAQATLAEFVLDGLDVEGRGPIIIAVDNSGSMGGQKEVWSKAVLFALLRVAQDQKRDVVVLHFDEDISRTDKFENGKMQMRDLLDTLEFFSGGGTNFNSWMEAAITQAGRSRFDKADVVVITDGYGHIAPDVASRWNAFRKARAMQAYCVLIGPENSLEALHNTIGGLVDGLAATDPTVDPHNAALNMVFGVGIRT